MLNITKADNHPQSCPLKETFLSVRNKLTSSHIRWSNVTIQKMCPNLVTSTSQWGSGPSHYYVLWLTELQNSRSDNFIRTWTIQIRIRTRSKKVVQEQIENEAYRIVTLKFTASQIRQILNRSSPLEHMKTSLKQSGGEADRKYRNGTKQ